MAHVPNEKTRTGNHVLVRASGAGKEVLAFADVGAAIGRTQNVSTTVATGAHEVSELGNPEPQEVVHGLHRYNVSLDTLTFRDQDSVGVVTAEPVDIEIYDRFGLAPVKRFFGCTLADERYTIPKHMEVARGLTFIALGEA